MYIYSVHLWFDALHAVSCWHRQQRVLHSDLLHAGHFWVPGQGIVRSSMQIIGNHYCRLWWPGLCSYPPFVLYQLLRPCVFNVYLERIPDSISQSVDMEVFKYGLQSSVCIVFNISLLPVNTFATFSTSVNGGSQPFSTAPIWIWWTLAAILDFPFVLSWTVRFVQSPVSTARRRWTTCLRFFYVYCQLPSCNACYSRESSIV